jgi:hypothetical protein
MKRSTLWIAAGLFLLLECWFLADAAEAGLFRRRGHHRHHRGSAACGCHGGGYYGCGGGHRHHGAHNGYAHHGGGGCCGPVAAPCQVAPAPPSCCGTAAYGTPVHSGGATYGADGYVPGDPAPSPEPPMAPDESAARSDYSPPPAPSSESSPSDVGPSSDGRSPQATTPAQSGESSNSPPPPPSDTDTSDGLPPDA